VTAFRNYQYWKCIAIYNEQQQ